MSINPISSGSNPKSFFIGGVVGLAIAALSYLFFGKKGSKPSSETAQINRDQIPPSTIPSPGLRPFAADSAPLGLASIEELELTDDEDDGLDLQARYNALRDLASGRFRENAERIRSLEVYTSDLDQENRGLKSELATATGELALSSKTMRESGEAHTSAVVVLNSTVSQLKEKLDGAKQELQALQAEYQSLDTDDTAIREKYSQQLEVISNLEGKIKKLEGEVSSNATTISSLSQDNDNLLDTVTELRQTLKRDLKKTTDATTALQSELEYYTQENSQLTERLLTENRQARTIQALSEQVQTLEKENSALTEARSQLTAEREELSDLYVAAAQKLQSENEFLKESANSLGSQILQLQEETDGFRTVNAQLLDDIEVLKTSGAEIIEDLQEKLNTLSRDNAQLRELLATDKK